MSESHILKCPECGSWMVLKHTSKYQYKNGDDRPFFGCSRFPDCDATHGAHPDGRPLGTPATKVIKKQRMATHDLMDAYMESAAISRKEMYTKLKSHFDHEIHCGELDRDGCELVQATLKSWIKEAHCHG